MEKSTKKKKKQSTNSILEQMEFYFSDSNLRRDKFLQEKITQSTKKGLDLSLFLNFNNIKALTTSVIDLKDALASSSFLSVDQIDPEDQVLYVARKDWEEKEDLQSFLADLCGNNQGFDKRTIYCENLPSNANQDWLRKLFSQFGKINLVSVPKFKNGKGGHRIKQFCFVEFANEEQMQTAVEYFKQFNGVLCYEKADNLLSIQQFQEEEEFQQQEKQPEQAPEVSDMDMTSEKKTGQDQPEQAPKKGKRRNRKKKAQQEGDTKEGDGKEEAQEPDTEEEEAEDEEPPKKKLYPELNDNMIYDLRIMPKMEWKRLRNKYLNLQREMVREMKKQAYFRRMQMGNNNVPEVPAKTGATTSASVPIKRHVEGNDEEAAVEEDEKATNKPKRRKRGREKKNIKDAIKKSSHIYFDTGADGNE